MDPGSSDSLRPLTEQSNPHAFTVPLPILMLLIDLKGKISSWVLFAPVMNGNLLLSYYLVSSLEHWLSTKLISLDVVINFHCPIYFFNLVCMFYGAFASMYVCAPYACQKRVSDSLGLGIRRLWAFMWLLGIKPGPSERAACALNRTATSSASCLAYL